MKNISNYFVGNVVLAVFKAVDIKLIGLIAPLIRTGKDNKDRTVSLEEVLSDFASKAEELKNKSVLHIEKREKEILSGAKIELPESHLSDSYDVMEQIDYVLEREAAIFDCFALGEELKRHCFVVTIKNDVSYLKKTLPEYIDAKAKLLKRIVSDSE